MATDITKLFKRAKSEVNPKESQRTLALKAAKTRAVKELRPDGKGKRGRKKVDELRVIKYVRLTPLHLGILNNVKRQLRTNSTSRAIKFCIEQWGRFANDSTVQATNDRYRNRGANINWNDCFDEDLQGTETDTET